MRASGTMLEPHITTPPNLAVERFKLLHATYYRLPPKAA